MAGAKTGEAPHFEDAGPSTLSDVPNLFPDTAPSSAWPFFFIPSSATTWPVLAVSLLGSHRASKVGHRRLRRSAHDTLILAVESHGWWDLAPRASDDTWPTSKFESSPQGVDSLALKASLQAEHGC